jgi:hypothetical protein
MCIRKHSRRPSGAISTRASPHVSRMHMRSWCAFMQPAEDQPGTLQQLKYVRHVLRHLPPRPASPLYALRARAGRLVSTHIMRHRADNLRRNDASNSYKAHGLIRAHTNMRTFLAAMSSVRGTMSASNAVRRSTSSRALFRSSRSSLHFSSRVLACHAHHDVHIN